jgi:aspartokinase-like uncharacterized kinase
VPLRTVVIKVGGSLLDWPGFPAALLAHLEGLRPHRGVLIVGGGPAADFVRVLDSRHGIGEKRSHRLALRALDLTAEVASALVQGLIVVERLDELESLWNQGLTPVLAPRRFVEEIDRETDEPLDESWEVTSDSIAARLAVNLRADELRLLKSTGPGAVTTRSDASRSGLVDPMFPRISAPCPVVTVVNLRADPTSMHVLGPG